MAGKWHESGHCHITSLKHVYRVSVFHCHGTVCLSWHTATTLMTGQGLTSSDVNLWRDTKAAQLQQDQTCVHLFVVQLCYQWQFGVWKENGASAPHEKGVAVTWRETECLSRSELGRSDFQWRTCQDLYSHHNLGIETTTTKMTENGDIEYAIFH